MLPKNSLFSKIIAAPLSSVFIPIVHEQQAIQAVCYIPYQAWHGHVGVINIEDYIYPIGLLSSCPHVGFELMLVMSSKLGVTSVYQMAKKLDATLSLGRLLYIGPDPDSTSFILHLGIEENPLPWCRVSESANDVPSCMRCAAAARQAVCYI